MTMKRTQSEQLKAVPDPLENEQRAARKPERETYNVYRLPSDDDDADAEKEFLLTLPVDVDVERRIKREYGAGSYRVERRRAGRFVSVTEMHFDEPPQQREDAGERESGVPEDLEERLAPIIAQAVDDVLEARRIERERTKALRSNPSSQATTQATGQAPDPVGDALRLLHGFKQLERETSPPAPTKSEPTISDEDRALMMLLKDRDMRSRITSSLFAVVGNGDGDGETNSSWVTQAIRALEQRPELTMRILDRLMPAPKEPPPDADDEDGEIDLEESCVTYLLEKCAANESVTLNDEPVRALAVANPQGYKDFIGLIQLASVEQIVEHLSKEFDLARIVLRAPHAHAWFVRLKELAAAVTLG
jgi:hypothetical protein